MLRTLRHLCLCLGVVDPHLLIQLNLKTNVNNPENFSYRRLNYMLLEITHSSGITVQAEPLHVHRTLP